MALIENLDKALYSPVKHKANRTGKLRLKAARVASGAAEVVVKITGYSKGVANAKANVNYISRHGKIDMENERGEVISGKKEVNAFFKEWGKDFNDSGRYKNQRDTMHMVLSMPANTDPIAVKNAAREFAKHAFAKNHEYVFALHTFETDPDPKPSPNPHVHLTVKCLGFDGKRLHTQPNDLQRWREEFAERMREQGVDAEATPRISRGVSRRPERSVIRHIEQGDKTHKPRVPKAKAARVKEAANQLHKETQGIVDRPSWRNDLDTKHNNVRDAWLAVADSLLSENRKITFNQKEAHNERPDYSRTNKQQSALLSRAANLYQSNLAKFRRSPPAQSVAGLRNVSDLDVVHDRRPAKVLLRSNAFNSLDNGRGKADTQMRRAGAGLAGNVEERLDSATLANRIRDFVNSMPPVETLLEQTKAGLRKQFTKQPEISVDKASDRQQALSPTKPNERGKDVER